MARRLPSTSSNWSQWPAPSMAWHALGAFGAWLQKEECQDYPPHWSPDCRRTLIVQIRVWFWAKSRSDFDFGQSQGLILGKSVSDFGQSQGLMLVNSRLNWRNSRLNLSKVKVWFWQGQGWIWAKSRSDFGKFKAEFGRLSNSMLNLRNSRLNLVKSGLDLQRFVGWFIPYDD